jgi:hypothetical protein
MERLGRLVRVRAVEAREPYKVRITFEDGLEKEVDLAPFLRGPIFQSIRQDITQFQAVRVIGSTIGWDNGADIDPDVLYYDLTPANADKMESGR